MTLDFLIAALIPIVNVTTPILLAATGELVVEKSGVLNLASPRRRRRARRPR